MVHPTMKDADIHDCDDMSPPVELRPAAVDRMKERMAHRDGKIHTDPPNPREPRPSATRKRIP